MREDYQPIKCALPDGHRVSLRMKAALLLMELAKPLGCTSLNETSLLEMA